jgi:hypothetical protein
MPRLFDGPADVARDVMGAGTALLGSLRPRAYHIVPGRLLLHMPTVTQTADLAAMVTDAEAVALGGDIVHPALGIGVLVVVAVLNIYKPRGQKGLGQHQRPDPAR